MPWIEAKALLRLRSIARRRRGVATPLRASGMVEPLVQAYDIAPSRVFLDRLVVRRYRHLRPTDLLRSSPRTVLVSERYLRGRARCFRNVNTRADLRPRWERPVAGAGATVIPVPPEASRTFWKAASLQMRGLVEASARGFLHEAEIYSCLGILHLELDCLLDAHSCLVRTHSDCTGLDRRIGILRSSMDLPRPRKFAEPARRKVRGRA